MPQVIITYKSNETLKVLRAFAKYFDFKITASKKQKKDVKINGVTIVQGVQKTDMSEVRALFSQKDIDAAELRKNSWQRK